MFEAISNIFSSVNTLTILYAINIVISIIILAYSFYLYKLEKKYNQKLDDVDDLSQSIVKEANVKALNILKNSEYLSKELRKEIEDNFEALLKTLTVESKDLYKQIEQAYLQTAEKFTQDVEQKAEQEIENISQQLVAETKEAEEVFQKKYAEEYQRALDEIEKYKEDQKEAFKVEIEEKLNKIIKELIPQNITIENHNKIVTEALEKAYQDKVFN